MSTAQRTEVSSRSDSDEDYEEEEEGGEDDDDSDDDERVSAKCQRVRRQSSKATSSKAKNSGGGKGRRVRYFARPRQAVLSGRGRGVLAAAGGDGPAHEDGRTPRAGAREVCPGPEARRRYKVCCCR
jgi:hypothetical protein